MISERVCLLFIFAQILSSVPAYGVLGRLCNPWRGELRLDDLASSRGPTVTRSGVPSGSQQISRAREGSGFRVLGIFSLAGVACGQALVPI